MKENVHVFIINGYPRSGKDTFIRLCMKIANEHNQKSDSYILIGSHSTIDTIKQIYRIFGWDGKKNPIDRKRLSDCKQFLTRKFDLPFQECLHYVQSYDKKFDPFIKKKYGHHEIQHILFLQVREPEEIQRLQDAFGAKTIYMDPGKRIKKTQQSNMGDANVEQFDYDLYISNDGSLHDLEKKAEDFVEKAISHIVE